ncbi:nitrate reductase subunit beta [Desulfurella sp.]|uniref:nitrate reductase subunit beta n=1 Tax=Desulfurella sp. TaxID=1962857 RepID=UPI003D14DC1E
MKVKAQLSMVLNLDKCIGCHTCSVTCKNVWTKREGLEYAWFNNVETKPGIGYPKDWENQSKYKGGWKLENNELKLNLGSKTSILLNIFANPNLPKLKDYYEPFEFDYEYLKLSNEEYFPSLKPISAITKKEIEIEWGPNWEDDLGGEFENRSKDYNFENLQKEIYSEFENTFMMYLPRLCNHCLNPACVASCPSAAIYKRDEDGIVLIDQNKCRGWRMCVSACPYKKIYFNYKTGKSEKCILCYPRLEVGKPTVCSESCVGKIRYIGVLLYDQDKIEQIAKTQNKQDLYEAQLSVFLDPFDENVIKQARKDGIPENFIEAAQNSPVYKMVVEWKIAFGLHVEFRTLPMNFYIPPLSPIVNKTELFQSDEVFGNIEDLSLPVDYLANLLCASNRKPIVSALKKLMTLRGFFRKKNVEGIIDEDVLKQAGLSISQAQDIYRYLAIAKYEDRYVIPTLHSEFHQDNFKKQGTVGFLKNDFGG